MPQGINTHTTAHAAALPVGNGHPAGLHTLLLFFIAHKIPIVQAGVAV